MPKLTILHNKKPYNQVEFNSSLSIGRDRENDVILKGKSISRFHASIYQSPDDGYILNDLASRNHTTVGGQPIQRYLLSLGAIFQINDYFFTFEDTPEKENEQRVRLTRKIVIPKGTRADADKTVLAVADCIKSASLPADRMSLLLTLSNEIVSTLDYHEFMDKALELSMKISRAKRGFIALRDPRGKLTYSAIEGFGDMGEKLRVSKTMIDQVVKDGLPVLTANAVRDSSFKEAASVLRFNLKSVMCVPLRISETTLGCMYIDNPDRVDNFSADDLRFFTIIANQVAIGLQNARMHRKVKDELLSLKTRLRIKDQLIAKSKAMEELYQIIEKTARTNAGVLILGATGVGKELVARSVHNSSGRTGRFISLNCAAIPENLIESELFGFEKGAFSGAEQQKPGMFELADQGTIFLDEIGDMPLTLQPKLLRVLQEKKVMRLGGTRYVPINTRIVAATNKDLKEMIKEDRFRQDLYYRLTEMEVQIPPLKEREADILPLAHYLLSRFCEENDLPAPVISSKAKQALLRYDWPGNINELKNVLIRATITGNGLIINPEDLPEELQAMINVDILQFQKLADIEEQHIRKVLKLTSGNKKKAAELLGIARDTIHKKIKNYDIEG